MVRPIRVVLDPGHGGEDPGACHNGIVESQWNLAFCKYLYAHISHTAEPIELALSRTDDDHIELCERGAIINELRPDLVIHVHVNAMVKKRVRGGMLFHWPRSRVGGAVANTIAASLPPALKRDPPLQSIEAVHDPDPEGPQRWLQRPRAVMRRIKAPSVLLEAGFCSNTQDSELLQTPAVQAGLVSAVECGIHDARRLLGRA